MAGKSSSQASGAPLKKRKRDSKAPQPSDGNTQALHFSQVEDAGDWHPAVVASPGFAISFNDPLKAYQKKNRLMLHHDDEANVDFIAHEDPDTSLKHYVGVYDPETGEVKVMPAKSMTMTTALRRDRGIATQTEGLSHIGNISARMLLGEEFGTKKAKKAVKDLRDNAIASSQAAATADGSAVLDTAASAVLDNMADVAAGMATREALQAEADQAKPRPKMDTTATDLARVFSLSDLIPTDLLSALETKSWRDAAHAKQEIQASSKFVIDRVQAIAIQKAKALEKSKLDKLLRYYSSLLDWYRAMDRVRDTWKVPRRTELDKKLPGFDRRLLGWISQKFAPSFVVDRWYQHYFFTNLCAIALIIDGYSVDMQSLQEDTGLERQKLQAYFRELGCRVKPLSDRERADRNLTVQDADSRRIAHLKLPLDFPKQREWR